MRSVTTLYAILLLVWATMMVGLYVIFGLVLPAEAPSDEMALMGLIGTLKVALGAGLGLVWLQLWKKLTDAYFCRVVRARPKEGELT